MTLEICEIPGMNARFKGAKLDIFQDVECKNIEFLKSKQLVFVVSIVTMQSSLL